MRSALASAAADAKIIAANRRRATAAVAQPKRTSNHPVLKGFAGCAIFLALGELGQENGPMHRATTAHTALTRGSE
jgi:hypothetical protein